MSIEELRKDLLIDSVRIRNTQTKVEVLAIIYICLFMVLAGIAFSLSPPTAPMRFLSQELGVDLQSWYLAPLAFINAAIAPLMLLPTVRNRLSVVWKQRIYILLGMPVALYTLPIAWYVLRTGAGAVAELVYIAIFFSFVVIGNATYRNPD